LAPAIDVSADGFTEFAADRSEALGKLACGDGVTGEPLVVKLLELFKLAGF
jgi:hypothetical protein